MESGDGVPRYIKLTLMIAWFFGCIAGGIYGAWWLWPTGVTEVPLSNLTLAMVGKAAGAVFLPFIGLGLALAGADIDRI
jgi:hypothetical protein